METSVLRGTRHLYKTLNEKFSMVKSAEKTCPGFLKIFIPAPKIRTTAIKRMLGPKKRLDNAPSKLKVMTKRYPISPILTANGTKRANVMDVRSKYQFPYNKDFGMSISGSNKKKNKKSKSLEKLKDSTSSNSFILAFVSENDENKSNKSCN